MLCDVNKLFVFQILLATPNNVLPLHLKQTFPPIFQILTEGDRRESRLPFIFSTLFIWVKGLFLSSMNLKHMAWWPPQTYTNEFLALWFMYDEFLINNKQEYLVVDSDLLISRIGGFLGLFLGSSCLSIAQWIISQFKNCCNNK